MENIGAGVSEVLTHKKKEYNARGERMYENPIKRENAKKSKK